MSRGNQRSVKDDLGLLERETAALLADLDNLDPAQAGAATLCPGWTRAHVLTHLARNADALGNLARWAVTGERTPMYASEEQRDADIEAGAGRELGELRADVARSAARFAEVAEHLPGPSESVQVEARGGRVLSGAQIPVLRVQEVVFHHVDLLTGYSFEDADPAYVRRALGIGMRKLQASDAAPALTLLAPDGKRWDIAGGGPAVTGRPADLLLWLARGQSCGVRSDSPLPQPPAWG